MDPDIYLKKTVDFFYGGHTLRFRVAQDLFSSHQVDVGTHFLLKTVADLALSPARILDLGCGYGPIGLSLKCLTPAHMLHMVDRDALALDYARQNAALNAVSDAAIYGSLGYDDLTAGAFDLVLSNIPGKAGDSVVRSLLLDARPVLSHTGRVAVVVVAPLADQVAQTLASPTTEVLLRADRAGYAVFHYRFTGDAAPLTTASAFARGVYHRAALTFTFAGHSLEAQTVYGLPDFDTLGYAPSLLLDGLAALRGLPVTRALVFAPGQGAAPLALWRGFAPQHLMLADRDLLALRISAANLVRNGCAPECFALAHQTGLALEDAAPLDLIAGFLRAEEGAAGAAQLGRQAAALLRPEGALLVVAGSTEITRLSETLHAEKLFRIEKRKRAKGFSSLLLRRR